MQRPHYFFDWATSNGEQVEVIDARDDEVADERYWPEPGLFARDNNIEFEDEVTAAAAEHTFAIDGSWEASDFSRFYSRLANLYAIFSAIDRVGRQDTGVTEQKFLRAAIRERLWQGGGSYVGFFDEMFQRVANMAPLNVNKIQYASPGQIELKGDNEVLTEIRGAIADFESEAVEAKDRYRKLDQILTREGLKRASASTGFTSAGQGAYVRRETKTLLEQMSISNPDAIYAACDQNDVVFCKLALAIYRRIDGLHSFHAEGRMSLPD